MPTYVVHPSATGPISHKRYYVTDASATPGAVQVRKYAVDSVKSAIPAVGQIWPRGHGRC